MQTASTFEDAVAAIAREAPEYAIVDLPLGDTRVMGPDLVAELKAAEAETRISMLTGYGGQLPCCA